MLYDCRVIMEFGIKLVSLVLWITVVLLVLSTTCLSATSSRDDRKRVRGTEKIACEGQRLDLSCPNGENLHIIRATYGRFVLAICNEQEVMSGWNLMCMSVKSFQIVVERCHNQPSCSLDVNNNVFNDPCPGTVKYLQVVYTCVKPGAPLPDFLSEDPTTPPTTTATTAITAQPTEPTLPDDGDDSDGDGTEEVSYCDGVVERGIEWKRTMAGKIRYARCPEHDRGRASWTCGTRGWVGAPDLASCTSRWLQDVELLLDNGTSSDYIVQKMARRTGRYRMLGGDLIATTNILHESFKNFNDNMRANKTITHEEKKAAVQNFSKALVESSSNMLSRQQDSAWVDLGSETRKTEVATTIIHVMEKNAQEVAEVLQRPQIVRAQSENILLEINVISAAKGQPLADQIFPKHDTVIVNDRKQHDDNQIRIPSSALRAGSQDGRVKVIFAVYDSLSKYMAPSTDTQQTTKEEMQPIGVKSDSTDQSTSSRNNRDTGNSANKGTIVNSNVISASFVGATHPVAIPEPLTYTMRHNVTANVTNPRCVFWNFDPITFTGVWDTSGCRVIKTNISHTVCECDHMTNFAVLMDVVGVDISVEHVITLQVITYAGCLISIVCLFVCFLTFQCFRSLQSDRNTIHKNLVLSLLLAEIVFLTGIGQVQNQILCACIAGFLHFLFLCAFSWMCLEGIQLYVMLIEVFEAERSRIKWYYLFGYGVPVIIVAVAAGLYPQGYGTATHCWLSVAQGFIWSFVGPVILVITINVVMLSIAIYMMCKHANMSAGMKEKSRLNSISHDLSDKRLKKSQSAMTNLGESANANPVNQSSCSNLRAMSKSQSTNTIDEPIAGQFSSRVQSMLTRLSRSNTSVVSERTESQLDKEQFTPTTWAWVKSAFVLVVLLGLTWAFGLLFVNTDTLVMAYLFTILNALQGLFIFIFHCLMNEKVQKEYKKCVRRTGWLPECVRVGYGGQTVHVSQTPSRSNSSAGNYFTRLLSGRRRKRSSTTSLPKSMVLKNNNANYDSGNYDSGHGSSVFHESDGSGKCVDVANAMNDRLRQTSPSAITGYNKTPVGNLYLPAYTKTEMLLNKHNGGYNGLSKMARPEYALDVSLGDMCDSEYSDAELFKMTDYDDRAQAQTRLAPPPIGRLDEEDEGYDGYEVPVLALRRESEYEVPGQHEEELYHVLIPESDQTCHPAAVRDSGMVADLPESPSLDRLDPPSLPRLPEMSDQGTSMPELMDKSTTSLSSRDINDITGTTTLSGDVTNRRSESHLQSVGKTANTPAGAGMDESSAQYNKGTLRSMPNLAYNNSGFDEIEDLTGARRSFRRSDSEPGDRIVLKHDVLVSDC